MYGRVSLGQAATLRGSTRDRVSDIVIGDRGNRALGRRRRDRPVTESVIGRPVIESVIEVVSM